MDLGRDAIVAQGVTKTYEKTQALAGIDLTVAASGVTAILGANGAGKTTLINCALGLTRPTKGTIQIFGASAGSVNAKRRTGLMLQDADLPDLLSAREHIALFAGYYDAPLSVNELIELCDLSGFANKPYAKLSGGQKRRVQFALAMVGQPDLIFLDEPTTGLDTQARRGLWKIVRAMSEAGKAIILTTHYLEEADNLADRIVVMNNGAIIADGPTQSIREATGGAIVRCLTVLPVSKLQTLPAVRRVRESGRYKEILTSNQTETLKVLLGEDPALKDLTVTKPTMEEAFLDITTSDMGER